MIELITTVEVTAHVLQMAADQLYAKAKKAADIGDLAAANPIIKEANILAEASIDMLIAEAAKVNQILKITAKNSLWQSRF